MRTVFSHIVQKRLSQESENVATAALAFILDSSEVARNGLMKLLRGVAPGLPHLWFRTQQADGDSRPDMRGCDAATLPHVLIENKFWAGLTEQQPVAYLELLAKQPHPTVLLVVAPGAREHTLVRELDRKLAEAGVSATELVSPAGVIRSVATGLGPILALTSWEKLLAFLEREVADEPNTRGDLAQLRALCVAVDLDAFQPISAQEVSDQRTPAFMLQLGDVVRRAVALAGKDGVLDCRSLNPQADFSRIGRYAYLGAQRQVCVWIGIHFELWKAHGGTPLWVVFSNALGRAREVRPMLEPWAAQARIHTIADEDKFAVALELKLGEDQETVSKSIAEQLKPLADLLAGIRKVPEAPVAREPL
ncbi:MAG: hypothetical protein H7343_09805 [Undibacterium sp.]|nr:hypothetical protein [Opitutaceae bacterium]